MNADSKVVLSRHLRESKAHEAVAERSRAGSQGRSSGWGKLDYRVERGLLHWKVVVR